MSQTGSTVDLQAKIDRFCEWLGQNGVSRDNFEIKSDKHGGLCLISKKDFLEESTVFAIPYSIVMSALKARSLLPFDTTKLNDITICAALLIHEKFIKDEQSFWWPYLNLLPESFSTPLYYSKEELSLLAGTPAENTFNIFYEEVKKNHNELNQVLLDKPYKDEFTLPRFIWATNILQTRAFTGELIRPIEKEIANDNRVLLPLFDLLNNSTTAKVVWLCCEDGTICFDSSNISEGCEIFNNYGPKSNQRLLLTYGYCIENNPVDSLQINLKFDEDPLFDLKVSLLKKIGLYNLEQHINRLDGDNEIFLILRVIAMNETELYICKNYSLDQLGFIGYRNEMVMLTYFRALINEKKAKFENSKHSLPKINTQISRSIMIYRNGVEKILKQLVLDLDEMVSNLHKALQCSPEEFNIGKKSRLRFLLPNETPSPELDFKELVGTQLISNNCSSLNYPLLTLDHINSTKFSRIMAQAELDCSTTYILFLVYCLSDQSSLQHNYLTHLKELTFDTFTKLYQNNESLQEFIDYLLEDLVPELNHHFPDIIAHDKYTRPLLFWAAVVFDTFSIELDGNEILLLA